MSELLDFHKLVNNDCSALKFTIEFHQEKINFLDVFVIKSVFGLETSLYRKPTDRNTLLHGTSYHPESLKRSLPISQFSRICRICSEEDDFQYQASILSDRFRARAYKEEWNQSTENRFSNMSQCECLVKKNEDL